MNRKQRMGLPETNGKAPTLPGGEVAIAPNEMVKVPFGLLNEIAGYIHNTALPAGMALKDGTSLLGRLQRAVDQAVAEKKQKQAPEATPN